MSACSKQALLRQQNGLLLAVPGQPQLDNQAQESSTSHSSNAVQRLENTSNLQVQHLLPSWHLSACLHPVAQLSMQN
jgi:hypothetical protein